MSKVLIDRALLERVQERLDPHRDAVLWGAVCDTFHTAPSGTPAMPVKAYYHESGNLEGVRTRSVGLEVRKAFIDAPLVLESDAMECIACLEGEIAKRDEELAACRVAVENCEVFRARIAELESQFDGESIVCGSYRDERDAALAELYAIKAQEPVQVDYVAVMRADGDGGLEVEWLLEGGTAELMNGMYLCCVGGGTLLFEEGSGHLYAAPVSEAKAHGVVKWPEADEIMQMAFEEGQPADDASGYCFELEEFDLFIERLMSDVARLNAAPVQQVVPDASTKMQWPEVVALVNEVLGCEAHKYPCERGSIGHEMTGINFNSLARIIDRVRYAAAPAAPAADAGLVEARKANNELVNDLHVMTNKCRQLVDALTYLRECLDPEDYMGEISMHDFIDDALVAHRAQELTKEPSHD